MTCTGLGHSARSWNLIPLEPKTSTPNAYCLTPISIGQGSSECCTVPIPILRPLIQPKTEWSNCVLQSHFDLNQSRFVTIKGYATFEPFLEKWLSIRRRRICYKKQPLFCTLQGGKLDSGYVRALVSRCANVKAWKNAFTSLDFGTVLCKSYSKPVPILAQSTFS